MQKAFIVRPFGIKEGVDFDAVEAQLIVPALKQAGMDGSTTTEIFEAGNIREDMFRLLVTADVVVADVSIHNANVFYELGIRHGMRARSTFMLRSDVHVFPFDLQTDRYLAYDHNSPAASIDALARGLKATLDSMRVDSPVYKVLPDLKPPDPSVLRVVSTEFREAVERASAARYRGDLRLLAHEARDFDWGSEGLRIVGRAQFNLKAWSGAKETFQWLLEVKPYDAEASQRLATIHQRLDDLVASNAVIQRVIDLPDLGRGERAEALALRARNCKILWRRSFEQAAQVEQSAAVDTRRLALTAPQLAEAIDTYRAAFSVDLNHFYSGLNALGLLAIRIELAAALSDTWNELFDTDDLARQSLDAARQQFQQLSGAVQLSLQSARDRLARMTTPDAEELLWTRIGDGDYAFLTASRPKAVAQRYRDALAGAPGFAASSVRDQLEIFRELDVRTPFVQEALAAIPRIAEDPPAAQLPRALMFTGHMVDGSDRKTARFPNTKIAEETARQLIEDAVKAEAALAPQGLIGIAGGACGGDMLFHEVCAALKIETRLLLALPAPEFCVASVAQGGSEWIERYHQLCQRVPPRVLSESEQLPVWLRAKKDYSIWQRNNLWILFNALALNAENVTLLALWDGGKADGPGGTEDLIEQVRIRGHKNVVIPAGELATLAT